MPTTPHPPTAPSTPGVPTGSGASHGPAPTAVRAASARAATDASTTPTGPPTAFGWLITSADRRAADGLHRRLRPRPADSAALDLAGNDYLALCRHPAVAGAAADAARRWGAGSTGSRLVTGSTLLHQELEDELAAFAGAEAALVFSSGYAANVGTLGALAGRDTHLVSDRHNHASLIDGCRLSRARVSVLPHADPGALARALAEPAERRLVVTDSVFSVDGDAAALAQAAAMARETGAGMLVDDAHAFGVTGLAGTGQVAEAGLAGTPDVVTTVTLSKALGAQGGAVLGPRRVIDHLVDTARTFVFDTGLAPAPTAAALAALRLLRADPARPARVRRYAEIAHRRLSAAGLSVGRPAAAVLAVRASSPRAALAWADACRRAGVLVGCFRPPSVPDGVSRLRLTVHAGLTPADLTRALDTILATAPVGTTHSLPERVLPREDVAS